MTKIVLASGAVTGVVLLVLKLLWSEPAVSEAEKSSTEKPVTAPPADSEHEEHSQPAAFFPDKPSAHDYLDFHSYAATLAELIDKTQTPLTVGVFGAWGSGKTTLMGMIENSLRNARNNSESDRFVLVRFDAWKYYKEDALWRALLLRVLDALRPDERDQSKKVLRDSIEQLEQRLYRDVEWKEKGGLSIDWPKLTKSGASGALKLSFAFVPGVSTLAECVKAAQNAIGKGDVAGDVAAIAEAFQRDVIVHHRTQLKHIEQFQDEFSKLVKQHFATQRLVIFVDDLDRCLPEKAIEVLEAIKLFLDVEGCVFVLGIDQEVITRGLEARYKEIAADGQSPKFSTHYIEKLIQLPFHLPPIDAREIGSYLGSLNVAWPHADCAKVFAEALSPNPRHIKRTINVFMLLWKLAERRRESLGREVTALRLAKVVILQTAYPRVFDHLKSDGGLLKQLELLSRSETPADGNIDPVLLEAVKQTSLKKLFQLLPEDTSANFAELDSDQLTAFFSLARRAPIVTETIAKEVAASVPATGPINKAEQIYAVPVERPFQLRAPVRDFVGRAEELSTMVEAFRKDASIGVVTGMAGTGKTEFALQLAELLRQNYPDGQLFVDMQGTSEPSLDPADALAACIRPFADRDRERPTDVEVLQKLYNSHLNGKRVLILLDNAASAAQVIPLIPPKGSSLLITSRRYLVLPAMVDMRLGSLSKNEAIALFTSIAPKVPADVAAEICSLCEYLPLAIRAAASVLIASPDLDYATYVQQLRDTQKRIELLGAKDVNVSLEASFSLSYEHLSEAAAAVFRKLPVFSGTFDAEAEDSICDDPAHSLLSELVKQGVVAYEEQDGRYRLHPLLRLFAQQRATPEEIEAVGYRHAVYYFLIVETAGALYRKAGSSSIEGLALFDRDRQNIEAGFKWSAARTSSDKKAALLCNNYASHAAEILELRTTPRTRVDWFTQALQAARQLRDGKGEVTHLINLGGAHRKLGEVEQAINIYTEALNIAEKSGRQSFKPEILSSLGLLHRDRGEIQKAIKYFDRQLAISVGSGNLRGESIARVNMANAELITDKTERAIMNYEKAIIISHKINDLSIEGMALGNLGRAYNTIGDTERALQLSRRHLEISRELGDRLGEAAAHFNIALALEQQGDLEQARIHAENASNLYQQLESPNAARVEEWLASLTSL
ncbi:MAG TPA: P-loop NTPase fold protein [Pyrinomonadaceae bacterium]|nr:P-loop NTPase fold protein [Pyrinomonadaceae bacterium]